MAARKPARSRGYVVATPASAIPATPPVLYAPGAPIGTVPGVVVAPAPNIGRLDFTDPNNSDLIL